MNTNWKKKQNGTEMENRGTKKYFVYKISYRMIETALYQLLRQKSSKISLVNDWPTHCLLKIVNNKLKKQLQLSYET